MATPHLSLDTTEPTRLGSGFLSGLLSAILGIAGLGAVLALRFPEYLTFTDLRPYYSLPYVRAILHLTLVASFLLGTISAFLRANKMLALVGIGFTLAAALLGGSQVPTPGAAGGRAWLGVDFFVLNLLLYSAVFIPLERMFALRADQPVFRRQWPVDLTYFFINSLLIEVLTILTLRPALVLFDWARPGWGVGELPLLVQVPAILLIAHLSRGPLPLAIPRHSSLRRADGLACRLTPASRGRHRDARPDLRADLRARILRGGAAGLRVPGRRPSHVHSRERALAIQAPAAHRRDAGVSPLAPCGGA
jgi:hypothetical protein